MLLCSAAHVTMTDFIDTLLTSMSSKFNETNADLEINLNEDKTLKWRGLHNNQYAAVKKRNKDIKRGSEKTATAATDDPPLKSDSSAANNKATGAGADDVAIADVTQPIENNSSSSNNNNGGSSDSIAIVVTQAKSVHSEPSTSTTDKMEKTTANNDKEKESDNFVFRRTLRRKQNAATGAVGDETTRSTDDVSALTADKNRKIALRPKRHSSAGSASEHRSVSPRGSATTAASSEKDDASSPAAAAASRNTRGLRGRTKKSHDRENSVESQSNEQTKATRTMERKNSISHEVEDASGHHQPTPPKLRRSERMHTATPNNDHTSDDRSTKSDTLDATPIDQKSNDRSTEHATRSRKRTFEADKKPNETVEVKDEEKVNAGQPIEIDCVEIKDESEAMDVKSEEPTKAEVLEPDAKAVEHVQKMEDVEIIESDPIATSAATSADSLVTEPTQQNEDQLSNGSDGGTTTAGASTAAAAAKSPTAAVASRKRGRGRPNLSAKKGNLKLNMTIATRNSPVKKSPRMTSDETPFVYTIPKKDKVAAEQVSDAVCVNWCFAKNLLLSGAIIDHFE